ncbi:hypothetical protein SynRS9907_01992 [Synechococcus sp. RS9907]|nr:hypothetical protein SynRS9907_01992 [Synechococcus sp. RS9907]
MLAAGAMQVKALQSSNVEDVADGFGHGSSRETTNDTAVETAGSVVNCLERAASGHGFGEAGAPAIEEGDGAVSHLKL